MGSVNTKLAKTKSKGKRVVNKGFGRGFGTQDSILIGADDGDGN